MVERPIFIGGLSYSGKTQLRLMLNAHPDLIITRRTYLWPRYFNRFGDLERETSLAAALDALLEDPRVGALLPNRSRIEREFRAGERTYARLFGLFHAHHAERLGKARWGDQLGRVEQYAGPIFDGFPDARLIQMVRDPRERTAAARATTRGRPGKLGWETAAWQGSVELSRRNERRYPGRVLTVRYEDLVTDTERTLRAVCGFLGEAFAPAMLPFAAGSSLGPGLWSPPPPPLPARAMAYLEQRAAEGMSALGYQPHGPELTRVERLLSVAVDRPLNAGGALMWRLSNHRPGIPPEASSPLTHPSHAVESIYEQ